MCEFMCILHLHNACLPEPACTWSTHLLTIMDVWPRYVSSSEG